MREIDIKTAYASRLIKTSDIGRYIIQKYNGDKRAEDIIGMIGRHLMSMVISDKQNRKDLTDQQNHWFEGLGDSKLLKMYLEIFEESD